MDSPSNYTKKGKKKIKIKKLKIDEKISKKENRYFSMHFHFHWNYN